MDNLPSETLFQPMFQLNDLVESIPDTTRGVDPEHSIAVFGNIVAIKNEDGVWYRIKCIHSKRSGAWIPENRIKVQSKSLFQNAVQQTRTYNGKKRHDVISNKMIGQNDKSVSTKRRLEDVSSQLKVVNKKNKKLSKDNDSLQNEKINLLSEFEKYSPVMFTRSGSTAIKNREELKHIVDPIKKKLSDSENKNKDLTNGNKRLVSENKNLVQSVAKVKRSKRETVVLNKKLVEENELLAEANYSSSDEEGPEVSFKEDLINIQTMITGVSSRVGAKQHSIIRGHTYLTRLRHCLGWIQEIINGAFVAESPNIRQLGHDGGSISQMSTLCVSGIITDKDNENPRHLLFAASSIPAGKSAESTVDCIKEIFDRHKHKYRLFLAYCTEHNIDVSKFPSPEEITLKKMADFSIMMSDNAASALCASDRLIELVRELKEADFTPEQLSSMTKSEREELIRILRVGCFPHIRCLLAKWAIEEEEAFLDSHIPTTEQHLRLEKNLNSLLFAIQKNFRKGIDQYEHGKQNEFAIFCKDKFPDYVLFYTGRHGTGSRMDANFEVAYAIGMNFKLYLEYLVHASQLDSEQKILSNSIRLRLGSVQFKAPIILRARLWRTFFAPLRVLCNCHDLVDHNICDMGAVMDRVEVTMIALIDNSCLLRDPGFCPFSLIDWPCLVDYYRSRTEKQKGDKLLNDLEIERLYECEDKVENMVDQLVVVHARGILKALYHNAYNFLTSCKGKYANATWDAETSELSKHCVADNIYLAEGFLGRVDYHWRRGINFNMSTVNGLVMAKHGKLFKQTPTFWTEHHSEACLAMVKLHHNDFLKEEKVQEEKIDILHAKELLENKRKAEQKILKQSLNQISYFNIPTLRTIKTFDQLQVALKTFGKSETQKKDFLKLFICMYAIGFGQDVSIQFSNKKDNTIGTLKDLLERAKDILSLNVLIPNKPPIRGVNQSLSPSDFGLTLLEDYKVCCDNFDLQVDKQISEVLELDNLYGIKLIYDWNSIQRQYWDSPLSILQKEFKRGRLFYEENVLYRVIGLSWDTVRKEYALYYYQHKLRSKGPTHINDPTNRVLHSFFDTTDSYLGINDWDITWQY